MKNVIRVFIAIAVMGVMTVSAFAQGAGPGGQKGNKGAPGQGGKGAGGQRGRSFLGRDVEVLAKLNLTDGQKGKVKSLKETTQKKVEEILKSMGGPGAGAGAKGGDKGGEKRPAGGFSGMREKLKPIMDKYNSEMKVILTPPQQAAYEKGMKEMMEKMKAARGASGPGGVGAAGKGKGKGGPPPTA